MTKLQRHLARRIDTGPESVSFEDAVRVLRKMLWLEQNGPTWNFCTNGFPQVRLIREDVCRALLVANFAETFMQATRDGDMAHMRLTENGRSLGAYLGATPVPRHAFYRML